MATWHEFVRFRGSWSRFSTSKRTRQVVQRSDEKPELFEAYYIRQQAPGLFPPPETCIELWPLAPITATSEVEARDKALLLLEIADSGTQDGLFEQRPLPVSPYRDRVKIVPSPTHRAKAHIFKQSESRFLVRYYGALIGDDWEEGWGLEASPEEGETIPEGFDRRTYASDLESAERIALFELERIVAGGEVKPR